MEKAYYGCWPTMITPFTEAGRVDFPAIRNLVEWYIRKGADGIFAVCQSSEMFFLSEQEKLDIATAVHDATAGRVKVIASGHTADALDEQVEQLGRMWETGVDAVVLVSNRIAAKDHDEAEFVNNSDYLFRQLPGVTFGLYECPYPYLRLLSTDFLRDCAQSGKLVFLKDVSCSISLLTERIAAIKGTGLSLFNANTSTLLDSLILGADGYNGVMANFHVDIYRWLYSHFRELPEQARRVSDFLTLAAVIEARAYPVSAKYYQNAFGVPMTTVSRSKDPSCLTENAIHEVEALFRMETVIRQDLGL
ncbi:MAG: dihydrodipicolinate synthase family protein [Sphaerochaetaceae bacterium]|jgi:4-hydroxy-tetrahydrodipicolinate synthase